jgi:DNA repair exonuclease SbcCD ATPase subunit
MSNKVMRLIDPNTGLMECRVCGAQHHANLNRSGHYRRGSWQCAKGCNLERLKSEIRLTNEHMASVKKLDKKLRENIKAIRALSKRSDLSVDILMDELQKIKQDNSIIVKQFINLWDQYWKNRQALKSNEN